jgi:hypothetical protein
MRCYALLIPLSPNLLPASVYAGIRLYNLLDLGVGSISHGENIRDVGLVDKSVGVGLN